MYHSISDEDSANELRQIISSGSYNLSNSAGSSFNADIPAIETIHLDQSDLLLDNTELTEVNWTNDLSYSNNFLSDNSSPFYNSQPQTPFSNSYPYSPIISSHINDNSTLQSNNTYEIDGDHIKTTWDYDNGVYTTNINSSTLNFSYTCIRVLICGNAGPDKGSVRIYFDETFPALQCGYSPQLQTNTLIFSSERFFRENLQLLFDNTVEEGSHLIRISFEKVREN